MNYITSTSFYKNKDSYILICLIQNSLLLFLLIYFSLMIVRVRAFTMEGSSHRTLSFHINIKGLSPCNGMPSHRVLLYYFISTLSLFYFNFLALLYLICYQIKYIKSVDRLTAADWAWNRLLVRFFTTSCRPCKHALHHSVYNLVVGIATGDIDNVLEREIELK